MKSEALLAYCTFPDEPIAVQICETLVRDGVIACANVFAPHKAIYSWNGHLQNHLETAAILKLAAKNKEMLMEKIRASHPYENPALLFLEPDGGLPGFLNWICSQSS